MEISPNADADSVGQLLVYGTLWVKDNPGQSPPNLLLVTGSERSDIREVAESTGVEFLVV